MTLTFLAFQIHAVHFCTNTIFAAHLVNLPNSSSIEENSLSERSFSGVNVRTNTNVALLRQRVVFRSRDLSCVCSKSHSEKTLRWKSKPPEIQQNRHVQVW